MPKYLVVTRSFYDVERTREEVEGLTREACEDVATGKDEKVSIQDLKVEEVSVFPGEGGAE